MITFAPAKINLGLRVLSKRPDGFHDIETCMLEIPFYDIIEITTSDAFVFVQSGLYVDSEMEDNLCTRAFALIKDRYGIPNVRIHLRKQIPMGAGLGGGSSDAVAVLKSLINLFNLEVTKNEILDLSAQLGSDCPFFVDGGVQLASGRGEMLKNIHVDIPPCFMVLIDPGIHISTKEAYSSVSCVSPLTSLEQVLSKPISTWKTELLNDFEKSAFKKHVFLEEIKEGLYREGAEYAAMTGSGSAMYGLFNEGPELPDYLMSKTVAKVKLSN